MDTRSILIIANIRCGGTYLSNQLAETYDLKLIFEPGALGDFKFPVVVKANAGMFHPDSLCEYSKKFKTVILLDRRNTAEHLESAIALAHTRANEVNWAWKDEYDQPHIREYNINVLNRHTEVLKEVSSKLNIPINYYEDIYQGGKEIPGVIFKPNLSKKLRRSDPGKETLL